jgi:CRP-like cAMP-binding protein
VLGRSVPWPETTFLARLAPADRETLLSAGTPRQYSAERETLIAEGDTSTFVLVLLEGVVKVTRVAENGSEAFLALRIGGELVGEFAALDGRPRSATVATGGAVTVMRIAGPAFTELLRRHGGLAASVTRSIIDKTRSATDRRVDFLSYDGGRRVARILYDLAQRHGHPGPRGITLEFSLTQPELAGLASISEPQVQRVLRDLRQDGIVARGRLAITDMAKLAERAGFPARPA